MSPSLLHRRTSAVLAVAGLFAVVVLAAGCSGSSGTQTQSATTTAAQASAGSRNASGVDGTVGSVSLLSVLIVSPSTHGATYGPGQDVPLSLTVSNKGDTDDVLTAAATSAAGQVVYRVGTGAPAPMQVAVPAGGVAELRDATGPHLELTGLTQSLHSAQSVPITFTFQHAGPTVLNVPVQEYTAQRTTSASPTS